MFSFLDAPVDCRVQCNAIKPGRNGRLTSEIWDGSVDLQAYVLKQVIPILGIERICFNDLEQERAITIKPFLENLSMVTFLYFRIVSPLVLG